MKNYFKLFITLLIMQTSFFGYGQIATDTLQINYIGQKEGLVQLNAKAIVQDELGYLWCGTEDGLQRFNGYEFKTYNHNAKVINSIPDDHIRDLLIIKDTLWIASNTKSIIGLDIKNNAFFNLFDTINATNSTAYKAFKVNDSLLLFSVRNNFIIYNRKNKAKKIIPLKSKQKESFINDILPFKNKLLLATNTSEIMEFDINTHQSTMLKKLTGKAIQALFKHKDTLFIGTDLGLFMYHIKTKTIMPSKITDNIRCLYRKDKNNLFIGSKQGLYTFNYTSKKVVKSIFKDLDNKTYNPVEVLNITSDKKGNIWFGTEGEGVFHYNSYQKKFKTFKISLKEYPNIEKISSFNFLKENDSTLWIGCSFGIVKYHLKTNNSKLYKTGKDHVIYTIKKDKNNTIWAGGYGCGLLKYNRNSDTFKQILHQTNNPSSLPDNEVIEILPIDKNKLWVNTWSGGINEFNIKTEEFKPILIRQKQINRARISFIDSKNTIWIGSDYGLYAIKQDGSSAYYSENEKTNTLSNNRVFSINEDNQGNIWVGTSDGLTKINPTTHKTSVYYQQKGLPNSFIYTILIDNDSIWVSTNYGVSVLDSKTNNFTNYTMEDGLQNNEFNGKAAYKDNLGNFYFGGVNGFNIFNPKKVKENPFLPNVYVESIAVFDKQLLSSNLYNNEYIFNSKENVLTFNYVALNYINSQKVAYQFMMDGFDQTWRPITKKRSTTYTNLNSGNYTFKIKASNDSGKWNKQVTSLKIKILPPWYSTWWFRVVLIMLLILSVFYINRYREKKLKKDKIRLEQLIDIKTKELKQKNESIQKSKNIAEKQYEEIHFLMKELSHRVRNNLQIISSIINIQANSIDNKEAKSLLQDTKNRILSIAYVQNTIINASNEDDLSIFLKNITTEIINSLSDENNKYFEVIYQLDSVLNCNHLNKTLICLLINEIITNTFKHAFSSQNNANYLKISCNKTASNFILTIQDNGVGFTMDKTPKESMGYGLINDLIKQLNGTLKIDTKNGVKYVISISC